MKHARSRWGRFLLAARRRIAAALLRFIYGRRRKAHADPGPERKQPPALPTGPFKVVDAAGAGTLLLYVPRNLQGRLIDTLTGGHGYSHLAIDCGEIDLPTRKRVMVEATLRNVHRSFQDEYGARPCLRLPLAPVQVVSGVFSACVLAKVGEAYDYAEAFTRGLLDDPAKQICSDLATACLPPALREDIARLAETGALSRFAVSVYHRAGGELDLFVSPNGFAEYFGAPEGSKIPAGKRRLSWPRRSRRTAPEDHARPGKQRPKRG